MVKSTLIIGSSHLAYRVKSLVEGKGLEAMHLQNPLSEESENTINVIAKFLRTIDTARLAMIYVLHEEDEKNLETVIALMALQPGIPITTSLFNENIRPYLQSAHKKLFILNQAYVAASSFVEALYQPLSRKTENLLVEKKFKDPKPASDSLIKRLIGLFALIILLATVFFHFREGLSWLNAFYFVIVTVATVGYGDINLQNASDLSKIVGIVLILCSTAFVWLIFSLTIDVLIKKRVRHALGRKKYHFKDHIILCGLGRLGYFIAEELEQKGEKVLIIEMDENSPNAAYFRSRGMNVYIGNARTPRVLQDAGVTYARALISVVNNDYANIEIGLNARSFQPGIRLILRIFDESMAKTIKEKLNIHLTLSVSAIAETYIAKQLDEGLA
jgi:hypothetical protein